MDDVQPWETIVTPRGNRIHFVSAQDWRKLTGQGSHLSVSFTGSTPPDQAQESLMHTTRLPEPVNDTEAAHIAHCLPELRDHYSDLRTFMLGLGDDVTMRTYHRNTAFVRKITFAYVDCRPKLERIHVNIRRLADEEPDGGFMVASEAGGFRRNLIQLRIHGAADVTRAKPLIRKSYEQSGW